MLSNHKEGHMTSYRNSFKNKFTSVSDLTVQEGWKEAAQLKDDRNTLTDELSQSPSMHQYFIKCSLWF